MSPVSTLLEAARCAPSVTEAFFTLLGGHYRKHLNVKAYAELIGVTANHLIRCVRFQTGKTPLQWTHDALLQDASSMLESGWRVKEIALTLGYKNLANFNRFIKVQTGHSPTGYKSILDKQKHVLDNEYLLVTAG